MPKLTEKLIESLAHSDRKRVIIVRDSELTGFGIRIASRSMSYVVEARVNGKSKRLNVGRADLLSVDEARKEAIRLLAQMTAGVDPQAEYAKKEASAITLGEVLDHPQLLNDEMAALKERDRTHSELIDMIPKPSALSQRQINGINKVQTKCLEVMRLL